MRRLTRLMVLSDIEIIVQGHSLKTGCFNIVKNSDDENWMIRLV